jgi:hypothetical protein
MFGALLDAACNRHEYKAALSSVIETIHFQCQLGMHQALQQRNRNNNQRCGYRIGAYGAIALAASVLLMFRALLGGACTRLQYNAALSVEYASGISRDALRQQNRQNNQPCG